MTGLAKNSLTLCLMLSRTLPAGADSREVPISPEASITVRVYDYADVAASTLASAKRAATWIFRRAGISLAWQDCALTAEELIENPACEAAKGPTVVSLRILPRAMAERLRNGATAFGITYYPEGDGFPATTNVFHERVTLLAVLGVSSEAVTLGHVIAHELGHALLGSGSHSRGGIMHVPWQAKDLRAAVLSQLSFSAREAMRMQKQVRARMQAGDPSEPRPERQLGNCPGFANPQGEDESDGLNPV